MIDKTEVVTCKKTMTQAINMGEIALSMKLLANGWNIASMAVATRGWDFRVQRGCNANVHPTRADAYDGISTTALSRCSCAVLRCVTLVRY